MSDKSNKNVDEHANNELLRFGITPGNGNGNESENESENKSTYMPYEAVETVDTVYIDDVGELLYSISEVKKKIDKPNREEKKATMAALLYQLKEEEVADVLKRSYFILLNDCDSLNKEENDSLDQEDNDSLDE